MLTESTLCGAREMLLRDIVFGSIGGLPLLKLVMMALEVDGGGERVSRGSMASIESSGTIPSLV